MFKKKFRIRPYSPLWYAKKIVPTVAGGLIFFTLFMLLLWAVGGA